MAPPSLREGALFVNIPAMKRPAFWIAAGLVINIAIVALMPVGLYWMFFSGKVWPIALSREIAWTVAAVLVLVNIVFIVGLACLLRRAFRIWRIGAFAWALASAAVGLWPLAALLPAAHRLGNRPAARLAAWGGAAFLLAGAPCGIRAIMDIPAVFWSVIALGVLGVGLVLAALRRLDDNASPHRAFEWVFVATVATAIATQPLWHVRRLERQADETLNSFLESLGISQAQVEEMLVGRPPVAEADDPVAALDATVLEAEKGSFSALRRMVTPRGGTTRLHPLVPEEIDVIKSWFATHTNLAVEADAVSDSPEYRSCLPCIASLKEVSPATAFELGDPRLSMGNAISYANLVRFRACAALADGNGSAGVAAAVQFENLIAQVEHTPTLINQLVAIAIAGMEPKLLVPRIDLWREEDLLAVQRLADDAVAKAEQRARITLACEACFNKAAFGGVLSNMLPRVQAVLRGSRALDLWVAAESRALLRYEIESWEAMKPLFETALDEPLGDTFGRLEAVSMERGATLPPLASVLAPAWSSGLATQIGSPRNNAAFIRAAVAIERYRRKHGTLPPTLDALVPDFLPSVPVNVYDGQPLTYEPGPIEIPEEEFPVLGDPDVCAAKDKAEFTAEFGDVKQVSLQQLTDFIKRSPPALKPEMRTLPAQTLPGFRLTLPDYRGNKRRDTEHFFYIP